MKKSLYFAAALLSLAACTREIPVQIPDGDMTLVARTERPAGTRTVLEGGTFVYWEPGDEIAVFAGGKSGKFVGDLAESEASATFKGTLGEDAWAEGMDLWAVYPYSDQAAFDGGTVTTTLPSEQTARAGSFGKDMNLAVAHSTSNALQFYNVGGGVRFTLSQEGITEVVFEGLNGEILAGKVKVGFQEGFPVIQEVTEGKSSITLTPPEGESFKKDAWYYIVAIPGALENGFTFHFRKAGGSGSDLPSSVYSKKVTIKRGSFGVLTYVDKGMDQTVSDDVITFKDPLVKSIVVKYFDNSGDGELSFHEAAVVLSFLVDEAETRATDGLVSIFAGTGITTFDELQYFTGLTRIDDGAFAGCTELTSITIPENIESIGAEAFKGCTSLETITATSMTPPAIGTDAFANTNECPILVPEGAVDTYVAAWNEYKDRIRPDEYPEPEIVDLGLSVKWASYNLGGSNPEDTGDYFAWGELESHYSSLDPLTWKEGKEAGYDLSLYKWYDVSTRYYTKYCYSGSYRDYKYDMDSEDDAAAVHLGGKWRMPSAAEFKELLEKCVFEETTLAGVTGWNVTGPNGNSIFLPVGTGYFESLDLWSIESGNYWTSSVASPDSYSYSISLNPSSGSRDFLVNFRHSGVPVRPVYGDPGIPIETITLDKREMVLEVGETATLTATVLPENATIRDYTWQSGDTGIVTVSPTGVVTAVGPGEALVVARSYDPRRTVSCVVTVPYPVPDAVDLGLSVRWASFNLGAARPKDPGKYYGWGELDSRRNCSWNYYQWCRRTYNTMTKYCTDASYGYNGFVDGKTTLDPEDDAATDKLGGKWRMPTVEEMEELRTSCTWVWDTDGYWVTGPSGNRIFIPANGFQEGMNIESVGESGTYWTSSLFSTPNMAYYLFIEPNYEYLVRTSRSNGLGIRPVYGDRTVTTDGDLEGTGEEPWN